MKKPVVLYVTLYLPMRNVHGGANRMFEQLKNLSPEYDIRLVSFLRDWEEPGLADLKAYCSRIDTVRIRDKHSRSFSLTEPGFVKNYYSSEMNALLREKAASGGFDLIQFEYLPVAQYRQGLQLSAKAVLTEHQLGFGCLKKELEITANPLKKVELFFRYNRLRAYERSMFRDFDQVIFISSREAEAAGISHSFVSPMGVDTDYFSPDRTINQDLDLLFTGNFDNPQNVDSMKFFAQAIWPVIKRKRPETKFTVAGVSSLEKLGFLKGLDGIDCAGRVSDLRELLNRAKVFIAPARTGGGMRGKVLEALSMGKPVIASSLAVEGYDRAACDAVRMADRPEDFSAAALELLADEKLRQAMGARGRMEAESRYTWKRIFADMSTFYKGLLEHA